MDCIVISAKFGRINDIVFDFKRGVMLQVKVYKDVSAKEKITFPAFCYVNIRRFKLFSAKESTMQS